MNIAVTINSTLFPIKIVISKIIDVIPIKAILASNIIVKTIAATVIGIKYSDNSKFCLNKKAKLTSIKNINPISKTILQSSKICFLYVSKKVKKKDTIIPITNILPT